MKIKNGKSAVSKYKKQFLLTSKINNTLSFFNKKESLTKNNSNNSLYQNITRTLFYNKSFSKTSTPLNINRRNLSLNNINNTYIIEPEKQTTNLLNSLYKTSYFPKSFRNKKFVREIYNRLPYLQIKSNTVDDRRKTNLNDNNKVREIIIDEYRSSVSNFHDIYENNGEELFNEIKNKEMPNETAIDFVKSIKINKKETNYISSIIKPRKKDIVVELENENYLSPINSLMTLKINNQLVNNIRESVDKYQYNSYVEKINGAQQNKLKLLIMPKLSIKLTKYHFESSQKANKEKDANNKKQNYYKKYNALILRNSTSKIDNKEKSKTDKDKKNKNLDEINNEDINPEPKSAIEGINTRNTLIVEIKSYYCKYLKRKICSPSSRVGASLTKYKSTYYLFGGSTSKEINELWTIELKDKGFFWKKIDYISDSNIILNPRYGHSCVYFNNNLYIFGGNINLKTLRNPLEDILIYNLKSNTLKIGTFKKEKATLTVRNIYVPQRRNHIAQVIGWNMVVHGGIDISKEYLRDNTIYSPYTEENRANTENNVIKTNETFMLNDWMMLDLITLKWAKIQNITYRLKDKTMMKNAKLKGGVYLSYHSSCLVLSYENIMKGNKINIYRNNNNIKYDTIDKDNDDKDSNAYDFEKEGKYIFDIKYEGIYIFGGLDENLKETNNLFILHCFRNPLIFFEPQIKGNPPEKRYMSSINFDKNLNIVTLFGGKDSYRVFNDLFILDIMNFQWIRIRLFGPDEICRKAGHCSGIINNKLLIFGGCDENNKYPLAKTLCIELDILRNKYISKIHDYARQSLKQNPKDPEGKFFIKLLREGNELPKNISPLWSV